MRGSIRPVARLDSAHCNQGPDRSSLVLLTEQKTSRRIFFVIANLFLLFPFPFLLACSYNPSVNLYPAVFVSGLPFVSFGSLPSVLLSDFDSGWL